LLETEPYRNENLEPKHGKNEYMFYDMQGRQVRQLVNAMQNVGSYNINFKQARMMTGYYIVEFKAGSFIAQKRLALIN
jgi:hypothetical protein